MVRGRVRLSPSVDGSACGFRSTFKDQAVFESALAFLLSVRLLHLPCICAQALGGPGMCEFLGLCLLSLSHATHQPGVCGELIQHLCDCHIACLSLSSFQLVHWSVAAPARITVSALQRRWLFLVHSPLRLLLIIEITAAERGFGASCFQSNRPLAVKLLVFTACPVLSC